MKKREHISFFKKYLLDKMGLNIGANAITSGSLYITTILLVIMGILLVSASNKVRELPEFDSSDNGLKKIDRDLRTAFILAFISAGVIFLIGIAYTGHETVWCPSEWWHGLFGLVALIILVISAIFAYIALNALYTPELEDRNGADLFIWASLIVAVFAFLGMGIVGSGRAGYNAVGTDTSDRLYTAEKKLHEAHSAVTGQEMEYKERPKWCPDECDEKKEKKQTTYVMTPRHRMVSQPAVTQSVSEEVIEQPLGPPIVTRHSVVTTSQPMLSSPSVLQRNNLMSQPGGGALI